MALSVGTKLGPYEILAPIGDGGMGEVWKARDTRLDRIVAIKRLKSAHSERFEQEARAIAALNHPHICQIYDIGPDYLVLEYIDGSPIKGPMPAKEAVRIAIQIASALEAAHARGILHRDLKPGNVLLTASGPKLLDFGLAKLTADSNATQTMAVMGTPLYMSPEQAEGKPLDARSDVFSFGSVLYELLTGRRAFESLAAVLRDDPAPLESPAAAVVARCLAKMPSQRFQNVAEVREALERTRVEAVEQKPSIAVLPFANMSLDKEQEFFSDGLAEEILNLLAKIPELKVIARTSSFAFRGKEQDITKIADTLRVRTILEGSVRRSGSRIRVTAQLIDASDGSHLWSERYDRQLTDVFEVQDEVAAAIAGALRVQFAGPAVRKHQPSLPAYEALLRGRHEIFKISPEGFERGREFLERAIALDPEYAEPHSLLGSYYYNLAVSGLRAPTEVMPLARASAARALELEPSHVQAHKVLCFVAATYEYDWEEAEKQLRLAAAAANSPATINFVGSGYLALGRFDEQVREAEAAIAQDPLNAVTRMLLMASLCAAGSYDRVIVEARKAVEINEHHWGLHYYHGCGYAYQGRLPEAREPLERALQLAPWHGLVLGTLAGVLACLGEKERADQLTAKIPAMAPGGWVLYHRLCSNIDAAADWFEKAIEQRHPIAAISAHSAFYKPLRDSPRWPKLARMMNLSA
jgi:TolB-like protein/predicted Ser/Thr protein kinase